MRKVLAVGVVVILTVFSASAFAGTVYNAYSGWYDDSGNHSYNNTNYFSGNHFGPQLDNFFLFDLSGVSGGITSASFNVYTYGISTSGTYTIYGTSLPTSVQYDCSGCVSNFAGLTSGPAIGSISFTTSDANSWLTISLNGAGLAWLTANEGSWVVLGGSNPQPNTGGDLFIFGYSVFNGSNNLTINSTPEPGSLLLLGSGILGAAGILRRKLLL